MRILERQLTQYQPYCDWCDQNVGAWYSVRRSVLRVLVHHRRIHRYRGLMGKHL